MINGIIKTPLKQFHDDRGKVMHMLRSTDEHFQGFGEVYFSWVYPNAIKAWHKHTSMVMNYAVPVGYIKVVLFDDRPDSVSRGELNEFYMNSEDYYLLTVPHGVWYGFRTVDNFPGMIVNCSTIPHDPNEIVRIDCNDPLVPYKWNQHG